MLERFLLASCALMVANIEPEVQWRATLKDPPPKKKCFQSFSSGLHCANFTLPCCRLSISTVTFLRKFKYGFNDFEADKLDNFIFTFFNKLKIVPALMRIPGPIIVSRTAWRWVRITGRSRRVSIRKFSGNED